MPKRISETEIKNAVEAFHSHKSRQAAADSLSIPVSTLKGRLKIAKSMGFNIDKPVDDDSKANNIQSEKSNDTWTIQWTDLSVSSDDILDMLKIDKNIWIVEKETLNGWDMTGKISTEKTDDQTTTEYGKFLNCQRKLVLKRIVPLDTEKAINEIISKMPSPKWPKIKYNKTKSKDKLLFEASIIDHHFGSLAWYPESNENYDLNIAAERYEYAVNELISCINNKDIDRILYLVGHDLLHSDGASGETAHGTPQDLDGRWQKAYITAYESVTNGIEKMAQIAPVDVIIVPGNHDKTTTFYLGHALYQRYLNTDDININNDPKSRKYYKWGNVLLGFCHGGYKDDPKEQDLPLIMAQELPSEWAETTWREWHLGDQHVHRNFRTASKEGLQRTDQTYNGVIVRRLPSLCGTNAWHYGKGYSGFKGSEAYLWSKERGPIGSFTVPLLDL